jgi:enoyl-CoA hydratase
LLKELLALLRAMDELPPKEDPDQPSRPRAVVLTGAGDKAFAAGADVEELAGMSAPQALGFSELGHELTRFMERCSLPIIAAVQGFALGGGCELALAADFIIAADNAVFGQPEVKLGLIPGFGGTQRLARRVGIARARQMIYTGKPLRAAEAKALGLVNEVVPRQELLSRVQTLAGIIAKNAPLAVSSAKRAINEGFDTNLGVATQLEANAFAALFGSEDTQTGIRCFLDKQDDPEFKGR